MSVLISNELLKIISSFGVTSVCVIGAFAILSASFVIQGVATDSYTMQFHGILRVVMYALIFGALFVSGYKLSDIHIMVLLILSSMLIAMIIYDPWRDLHFQIVGYLSVLAASHQPYLIYKNNARGDTSITMLTTYNIGVIFWMIYAWLDGQVSLFWLSFSFFIVYTTTMVLWYKAEDSTNKAAYERL
jgi:hypothetical protein